MVELYKDANFNGTRRDFEEGEYPSIGDIDNKVSSLKVGAGWYVELYPGTGFRGDKVVLFTGEYGILPSTISNGQISIWNDQISSMKVRKHYPEVYPLVRFYEHANFTGFEQNLAGTEEVTEYPSPFLMNDSLTSLKVPEGCSVVLYKDTDFRGSSLELGAGEHYLGHYGFNDLVSSMKIRRANLELIGIEYTSQEEIYAGRPISISGSCISKSSVDQVYTVELKKTLSSSISRSWSDSTMNGIEVSETASMTVEGVAVSGTISTTISRQLENTFTVGEEEITSETAEYGQSVSITLPPNHRCEASIELTLKKYKVEANYIYRLKGSELKGKQKVTFEVDDYQAGEVKIETRALSE
ncbi:beta and gamma crystallin [Marinomonas posidonica IVIA-Po-181]|uniref:Beta and gamma crystallin n=2 Tax=Marinomonas TaxID=28253 RepID=F6CUY1_MARPP|nr:beta and gamma crystallin [Marinomonas posidonica IVIA-Po-181]